MSLFSTKRRLFFLNRWSSISIWCTAVITLGRYDQIVSVWRPTCSHNIQISRKAVQWCWRWNMRKTSTLGAPNVCILCTKTHKCSSDVATVGSWLSTVLPCCYWRNTLQCATLSSHWVTTRVCAVYHNNNNNNLIFIYDSFTRMAFSHCNTWNLLIPTTSQMVNMFGKLPGRFGSPKWTEMALSIETLDSQQETVENSSH